MPGKCNFGQSRYKMKKLYVDAILESKEVNPEPGKHQTIIEWVKPKDYSYTKTSPQYSMG